MISFGMRTDSSADPLIAKALGLAMEFMALTGQYFGIEIHLHQGSKIVVGPWANAVDFFEPLQWIPTSKRSRGRKLHDEIINVYGGMIRQFKTLMDSGEEVPDCLVKVLIESQEDEKLDWEDLCMLSAVFTLGGVHSVSSALYSILRKLSHQSSADIWHHPVVSCFDTFTPTCSGEGL